jgi:sugar phosphate isomerase/epimerase
VCDWITPLPADRLLARGVMGDGHIDFRHLAGLVAEAGCTGDVEIFNADLWREDPDAVVATVVSRYAEHVVV